MSTLTLMNLRTARSIAPRSSLIARPFIQARGKATTPFRLPDPRNEPNVRSSFRAVTAHDTDLNPSHYTKEAQRSAQSSKRP